MGVTPPPGARGRVRRPAGEESGGYANRIASWLCGPDPGGEPVPAPSHGEFFLLRSPFEPFGYLALLRPVAIANARPLPPSSTRGLIDLA